MARRQIMTFVTHLIVKPEVRIDTTPMRNDGLLVRVEILDGLTLAATDPEYFQEIADRFDQAAQILREAKKRGT